MMMNSKELKKKIESILAEYNFEIDYGKGWILDTEKIAEALIAERIGDVKEAEHRAEVAERAGRIIQRDMARVFDVSNPRICELIANIWDLAKKQAEKELAEERK